MLDLNKDDTLNAVLSDVVADQVRRALELGFSRRDVDTAVRVGAANGLAEYNESVATQLRKGSRR